MPSLYFLVCFSTPMSVEPSLFASIDADSLAVHEEQVVGLAMALSQRELADRDPRAGVDVRVLPVLDDPARLIEQGIDGLPGSIFGRDRHGTASLCRNIRLNSHFDYLANDPIDMGDIGEVAGPAGAFYTSKG